MRFPIAALIWENWRLTRIEAVQRVVLGVVIGSGALLMSANGATIAFSALLLLNGFFYMSVAKLNGGRFLDGYKPGFPLYLLYTLPVRTDALVGVAMSYDAVTGALSYVVSAAILNAAFDVAFPLWSATALIVTLHLFFLWMQWSTRSRVFQWIGSMVFILALFVIFGGRAVTPEDFQFPASGYALMLLVSVISVVLTVAGVARQRRGDASATRSSMAKSGSYPDWLVGLFRFACPTTSAARALVWFEMRSSGLPVLAIGLGFAVLMLLLFALGVHVEVIRPFAIASVIVYGPLLLLFVGGNAFGIRRRQGRSYASGFEITQPFATANLAGLKILVRTLCVFGALLIAGASAWMSSALIASWGTWIPPGGDKDTIPELLASRQDIGEALAGILSAPLMYHAGIVAILVVLWIVLFATFMAARVRYPRAVAIAMSSALAVGVALVLLAIAGVRGIISPDLVGIAFKVTAWSLLTLLVGATLYLLWRSVAEYVLTPRYGIVALVVSVCFGAAWLGQLGAIGVELGTLSLARTVGMLWPLLLPPFVLLVAPWAFARVRHS